MSTDLVKIETNVVEGYSSGLDAFTIRPSIVKLVQPTSKMEDVMPGTFYDTLDGSSTKELNAIILTISVQRDYYPAGNTDFSGPPLCKSLDGIKPWPESQAIQASSCAQCPKSKWQNGTKPECSEAYRLLYLDVDSMLPKIIHFRRRGLSAVKQFGEVLKARIYSARSKGEGSFDMPDFRVTIKAKKDGVAYVPLFTSVDLHGKDIKSEIEMYVTKFLPREQEGESFADSDVVDVPFETV